MKRLATIGVALAIALLPFATAFAQSAYWEVRVSEPFTETGGVTNQTSFNLEYKILATDEDDTFTVDVDRNSTNIHSDNSAASDSYSRNVNLPTDGTYTFEITVNNNAVGNGNRTHTFQVERDTTPPDAADYGQKSQSGNQHTVTFTVDDPDAARVNIYSSTSTTFTANSNTLEGNVSPTGEQQSFTYTAGSGERYHAVQVVDAAGNVSPLVGDPDVDATFVPPPGGTTTGATPATTTTGTGDGSVTVNENGEPVDENGQVIGEDGEILGAQDEEDTGDQEDEDGETLGVVAQGDGESSDIGWYVLAAIIVAGIGYYLWRRRTLNRQ